MGARYSLLAASTLSLGATAEFVAGTTDECYDHVPQCAQWAREGQCQRNLGYMMLHACRVSCGSCRLDAADVSPIAIVHESFMTRPREMGSCALPVPKSRLRWGVDADEAARLGCHTRHELESRGSWLNPKQLWQALERAAQTQREVTFYDTTSSKPLFVVPRNRTMGDFMVHSREQGYLTFNDEELVLDNLRQVRHSRGEIVSVDGAHLGHNNPAETGSRYHVNHVAVAGMPPSRGVKDEL